MISCTRRLDFCAGHRVHGHESKCRNLHGHNYSALVTAQANLDTLGRVIDFSVLKATLGAWIDEHWDHGFILWKDDAEALRAVRTLQDSKLFILPDNPTAENLANYILRTAAPIALAGAGVMITEVVLWETPNCYATAKISG